MTEAVAVSNVIAVVSLVSDTIRTDRQTNTHTYTVHTHTHTHTHYLASSVLTFSKSLNTKRHENQYDLPQLPTTEHPKISECGISKHI